MLTIIRQEFLDLSVGPQMVTEWFKAWLAWRTIYLRQNPAEAKRGAGVCRVVCTLGGYPHAQVESAVADWKRFLPREWFEGVEIGQNDLLVVRSIAQKIPEAQVGPVVSAMFSGLSDGMAVMLELVTWDGGEAGPKTTQEVLVLYGLAEGGQFLLKAMWPKSLPHDDGSMFSATPWGEEQAALEAFQRLEKVRARIEAGGEKEGMATYIAQDEVHAGVTSLAVRALTGVNTEIVEERKVRAAVTVEQMVHAVTYVALDDDISFVFSPAAARSGSLFVKVFFGTTSITEKFSDFLKRAGGMFALNVAMVLLARAEFLGNWRWVFWVFSVISGLALAFILGWKVYFIRMYRKLMREGLAKVYNEPWSADEVTQIDAQFANQPTVRKMSADVEALGGRHVVDLDLTNIGSVNFTRVYFMPDSKAYFYLSFLYQNPDGGKNFPVLASFLVRTLYEDGVVVATVDRGIGFKRRLDKRSCSKMFVGVTGVKDMLERHLRAQRKFVTKAAGPIALSKEEFIEREKSDHERISELNRAYGYYRLLDAIGDSFGWIRRDFREEGR